MGAKLISTSQLLDATGNIAKTMDLTICIHLINKAVVKS